MFLLAMRHHLPCRLSQTSQFVVNAVYRYIHSQYSQPILNRQYRQTIIRSPNFYASRKINDGEQMVMKKEMAVANTEYYYSAAHVICLV